MTDQEADALRARSADLEQAARVAASRINDALAWFGWFKDDLHPAAAADLYAILTGARK
jgi:hypothetical protein